MFNVALEEADFSARYSLLVTFYSLLVAFYSLLITFYSLLIAFLLVTCYFLLVTHDSPIPNFRPQKAHFCTSRMRSQPQLRKDKYIMTQIVHLGPRIFRPQIIWPDPNCRPQISKLAPRSKSPRVSSPPPGMEPDFEED